LREVEDEWQQVPEEWLAPKRNGKRKAREADQESELSDLTDEAEHNARLRALVRTESAEVKGESEHQDEKVDEDQLTPVRERLWRRCVELTLWQVSGEPDDMEAKANGHTSPMKLDENPQADGEAGMTDDQDEGLAEKAEVGEEAAEAEGHLEGEEAEEETDEVKLAAKAAEELPAGFVEWEAVS